MSERVGRRGGGWCWSGVFVSLALMACGGGTTATEEGTGASPVAEEGAVGTEAPGAEAPAQEAPASQAPRLESRWLRTQGGPELEGSERVAVDAEGNTFTAFQYWGPAEASNQALPWSGRVGESHLGIAKYRPDGGLAWVRGFAPPGGDAAFGSVWVRAMAVDPRGNVFIGGATSGEVKFDEHGVRGTFLAKLERDTGRVLWVRTRSEPGTTSTFQDFASDAEGHLVALSRRDVLNAPSPSYATVLTRYHGSDGTPLWERIYWQKDGHAAGTSLAVDGGGNLYIGGAFAGRVDFGGPAPLEAPGESFLGFILALTPEGRFRWSRSLPSSDGYTYVMTLAAERSRVLVTSWGAAHFQGVELPRGTHLLCFSSGDGGERWARHLNHGFLPAFVHAVGEEAVVVGRGDAALLGNPSTPPRGEPGWPPVDGLFVAKFWRTSGRYLGSRNLVPVAAAKRSYLIPMGVALSRVDGEVAITGHYAPAADFGTGATVTSRGNSDTFLLRLKP